MVQLPRARRGKQGVIGHRPGETVGETSRDLVVTERNAAIGRVRAGLQTVQEIRGLQEGAQRELNPIDKRVAARDERGALVDKGAVSGAVRVAQCPPEGTLAEAAEEI